ncbi:MAG: PRTRC system protein B [Sphingobium limneticum]
MANHSVYFGESDGGLVLTNAILLYRSGGAAGQSGHGTPLAAPAFASIHGVVRDDLDRPTIAAGKPLSQAHLRHWTQALGRCVQPEILPDNVLVSHPEMLAWWTAEQVRTGYFALSNPPADLKALSGRTSVPVPYPAHLFIATRSGLDVYALPRSCRPTADTPVLHSPILNIFIEGKLCWGNIAKPKALTVASIADYESAVFDSWSTHPNPGQDLTLTGKGGLVRLWDALAAQRATRFPVRRLKPFLPGRRQARKPCGDAGVTVGDLIARGAA